MSILHYSLEKGMRSFTATLVKTIRKGKLQSERYHLHVIKTPHEARNAFRYVLLNHCHHTKSKFIRADEYCSLYHLNLKLISKIWKVSIINAKVKNPIELDSPTSWFAKSAYS